MGYVLLGHSGVTVGAPVAMEVVALDPETTIQFFADTGQILTAPKHLVGMLDELERPWPPLDSRHVTYNLELDPLKSSDYPPDWLEAARGEGIAGHTLLTAEDFAVPRMCSGDPDSCPTDPRQVVQGRRHECEGILAELSGQDILWIACVSLDAPPHPPERAEWVHEAMDIFRTAVLDDRPSAVTLGYSPDDLLRHAATAFADEAVDHPRRYYFGEWFCGLRQHERARVLAEFPDIREWFDLLFERWPHQLEKWRTATIEADPIPGLAEQLTRIPPEGGDDESSDGSQEEQEPPPDQ